MGLLSQKQLIRCETCQMFEGAPLSGFDTPTVAFRCRCGLVWEVDADVAERIQGALDAGETLTRDSWGYLAHGGPVQEMVQVLVDALAAYLLEQGVSLGVRKWKERIASAREASIEGISDEEAWDLSVRRLKLLCPIDSATLDGNIQRADSKIDVHVVSEFGRWHYRVMVKDGFVWVLQITTTAVIKGGKFVEFTGDVRPPGARQ